MKITLTTGGATHYEIGLVSGLLEQNISLVLMGGDELCSAPVIQDPRVSFKNVHGESDPNAPAWLKGLRVLRVYLRLISHAARTDTRLFHLQWPYKLPVLDRTALNLYYKALGKKLVFTAHNVDGDARDGTSTWLKRFSLRFHYRIVDHIIVHTDRMKEELIAGFQIPAAKISVIPHGIMSSVPETCLTRLEARLKLGLQPAARVLLFFGLISPYKGLETLVQALARLKHDGQEFTLVIAGRIKECPEYWDQISRLIREAGLERFVVTELRHIPDDSVELYFKAADVLVLPYRGIFQSGVLFLAYRFGLPVVATDVGSFKTDILSAGAGSVCRPGDPADMAITISRYFAGDLFKNLESSRAAIKAYAAQRYSWSAIGQMTRSVYERVLQA